MYFFVSENVTCTRKYCIEIFSLYEVIFEVSIEMYIKFLKISGSCINPKKNRVFNIKQCYESCKCLKCIAVLYVYLSVKLKNELVVLDLIYLFY